MLIWVGIGVALVAIIWIAWSMCRAAADMDRAFDALDREMANRRIAKRIEP